MKVKCEGVKYDPAGINVTSKNSDTTLWKRENF